MPDLDALLSGRGFRVIGAGRAARAWQRIQDRSTSITVYRAGIPLDAQTVRIEFDSASANLRREAGEAAVKDVILFGVKDHPTVDDTDLAKNDEFKLADGSYRVIDVIEVPGEVQARAERIS